MRYGCANHRTKYVCCEADILVLITRVHSAQLGRFTFQIANEIDSLTVYKKFIRTLGNYVKNCEPIKWVHIISSQPRNTSNPSVL